MAKGVRFIMLTAKGECALQQYSDDMKNGNYQKFDVKNIAQKYIMRRLAGQSKRYVSEDHENVPKFLTVTINSNFSAYAKELNEQSAIKFSEVFEKYGCNKNDYLIEFGDF